MECAEHDHQVAVAEAVFEAQRTLSAVETARCLVEDAEAHAREKRSIAGREAANLVAEAAVRDAAETQLRVDAMVARLRNALLLDAVATEMEEESLALASLVADEVAAQLNLDETKTQLFASVIHELRTPMTSIAAHAELLQEDDVTAKQHERLDAIGRNVDMGEVVSAVRSAWQLLGDDRVDVSFVAPSTPLNVREDARSLESLVSNLVSNAAKFTEDGGWVCCTMEQREGWAQLKVSDNGIGIPAAEQQLLFSRFFRSSTARESGVPGTGLGLAIVQSILARHGGTISVDSSLERGTTVLVDLPLVTV